MQRSNNQKKPDMITRLQEMKTSDGYTTYPQKRKQLEQTQPFEPQKDFYEENKDENYVVLEISGLRATQEDNFIHKPLPAFEKLEQKEQKIVMEESFKKMQDQCGEQPQTGSTACLTTAWIKEEDDKSRILSVCNAHVGDSTSYLVIVREDKSFECQRLNETLHNPERRLLGSLGVNRSIGDKDYAFAGGDNFHVPDVAFVTKKLNPSDQVFIITACDGLTDGFPSGKEGKANEEHAIGQCVRDYCQQGMSEIAFNLMNKAFSGGFEYKDTHGTNKVTTGSTDNISIIVSEIVPGKQPILSAVFDGHGGSQVSQSLHDKTYDILKNEIDLMVSPKKLETIAEEPTKNAEEQTSLSVPPMNIQSDSAKTTLRQPIQLTPTQSSPIVPNHKIAPTVNSPANLNPESKNNQKAKKIGNLNKNVVEKEDLDAFLRASTSENVNLKNTKSIKKNFSNLENFKYSLAKLRAWAKQSKHRFFSKPGDMEKLIEKIRKLAERKKPSTPSKPK